MADTPAAPASAPDVIQQAMDRFRRAEDRERENRDAAYEDLDFYAGNQWPEDEAKRLEAEGRPALTLNQFPTFARQVMNDIRMMHSGVKVVPVDSNGDPKTAEIFGGMIRYIENRSDAQYAYNTGMESQVVAGIGHWQVTTEYASEKTFDQEIRIVQIDDGVGVLWDPDSTLPTREDAMWCFQPVDLTHEVFKERYPGRALNDVDAAKNAPGWYGDDTVRIARYWCKKPVKRKLALMADGSVLEVDTPEKEQEVAQRQATGEQVRVEERDGFKITQTVISQSEILEPETDWAGRFIPIVPVLGEEVRIGREVKRRGIFRFAKDAQRMFNYAQSAQVEAIALQPKAPWLVTEDNVKAYAAIWAEANNKPLPYLPYRPDPANGGTPPQRATPAIASQGLAELIAQGAQTMKDVVGLQNAALGKQSNETSGKAITARQREGDVGMFAYVDNFSRAIRHTGAILVDLIPRIYDTQRMIRVMGEDETLELVPINTPQPDPESGVMKIANDLSVGSYDVVMQTGPGYTTRREEARDGMLELAKMAPEMLVPIMLDLIAKAQDWPLAEQVAERAQALLPPPVLALLADKEAAKTGQPPPSQQPQQPGPQEIKAMADAKKAGHDADAADAKAQQEQIKLGEMIADAMGLGVPVAPPAMPAAPQPGQPAPIAANAA